MADYSIVLIWVFGVVAATTMLGGIVRRRRDYLVGVLRAHVDKEIGSSIKPDDEAEPEATEN